MECLPESETVPRSTPQSEGRGTHEPWMPPPKAENKPSFCFYFLIYFLNFNEFKLLIIFHH